MRKSGIRIQSDVGKIRSDSFVEFCRNGNPRSFIRRRKMPTDDLAFSMINRKGLTLKLELRGYMNISHPGLKISSRKHFCVIIQKNIKITVRTDLLF